MFITPICQTSYPSLPNLPTLFLVNFFYLDDFNYFDVNLEIFFNSITIYFPYFQGNKNTIFVSKWDFPHFPHFQNDKNGK
jgi:hypothetical protein